MKKFTSLTVLLLLIMTKSWSREGPGKQKQQVLSKRATTCAPATARTQLEVNNVRALLETGGRMWQDRSTSNAAYEVPIGSGNTAIYSGALWMGGVDANDQLKIAAATFGSGNDYWTGPLTDGAASTDPTICEKYDKFFTICRSDVEEFKAWWECKNDINCDESENYPNYQIPKSILDWPGNGEPGFNYFLAPYKDVNQNGVYDPTNGDYPYYDIDGDLSCPKRREDPGTLYGDKTYWWIFNDNGNVHTESGGDPIGMEVKAQAFAFATNDELNDMTFYNYELTNRGTTTLYDTYFAQWIDPDLGCSGDDYVGCDVQRGLGYCYNGDAVDDANCNGALPYGANPPAIGVDFFEGPYKDDDGIDNPGPSKHNNYFVSYGDAIAGDGITYKGMGIGYGDTIVDNERFGMRKFMYYTGGSTPSVYGFPQQDPDQGNPVEHYRYLQGLWQDGSPLVYGGGGYVGNPGAQGNIACDYAFPGDSDPQGFGTGGVTNLFDWTENNNGGGAPTPEGDRRFLQSAGPFTLEPGAKNNITVGVVYARATGGSPFASVEKLRIADDKAQALFDNCFEIMEGPHAPDMAIEELDRELILTLSNRAGSNNANEDYEEADPFLPETLIDNNGNTYQPDPVYRFQGYIVYQLKNANVSVNELDDIDKARVAFQYDIKDGVAQLVNFEFDDQVGFGVPVEKVNGSDNGIQHAFSLKEDLFAEGDTRLVNHKTYHYLAIAYAHNEYKPYSPTDPNFFDGQQKPFISSRKALGGAIRSNSAIPHIPAPELNGTVVNSEFGDRPEITRIEGEGNGALVTRFTQESEQYIVNNYVMNHPTYQRNMGPVDIHVINPLNVTTGQFEIKFLPDTGGQLSNDSPWELTNLTTGEVVNSDQSIASNNEQLIPEWGIAVQISQPDYVDNNKYTDLVSSSIEFSDPNKAWLTGVSDVDNNSFENWIRIGTQTTAPFEDFPQLNLSDDFESIVNGTWSAYKAIADTTNSPAPGNLYTGSSNTMDVTDYNSVDIVITSNKDLWTRCPVIEMSDDPNLVGGTLKGRMVNQPSVNKEGDADGTGNGMSWFPGYAIDLETGERLNMAFGEDSWLGLDRGMKMMWDPSPNTYRGIGEVVLGGKQFVYVFKNRQTQNPVFLGGYDGGNNIETMMSNDPFTAWRSCMWVGMPLLAEGRTHLETDVRISIHLAKRHIERTITGENNGYPMYGFSLDGLATQTQVDTAAENALSIINVVPNPYYAYSQYENNRLDNRIKITNLPDVCTIRIYSVGGTLVKTITKDSPITHVDWDLKNFKGIPIASGSYIIHIDAPGIGERVLKWFGTMRPPDLENF